MDERGAGFGGLAVWMGEGLRRMEEEIPGYAYGAPELPRSPISIADLERLKQTVIFGPEDEKYLRIAGEVLRDQVDSILNLWYGFVGSHPHLLHYFGSPEGEANKKHLEAVRGRFGQWIADTCNRPFDQEWLNYQYEIALRHHWEKKGETDEVDTVGNINYRYLVAFIYPITATIRPFLASKGHGPDEVEYMFQAWFKAVVLSVALWSYPYVKEGDY